MTARLVVAIALAACACSHGAGEQPSAAAGNHGSAPAAAAPVLPPVDVSCAADADCALLRLQLTGDQTCCPVCGQLTPGRADWVRSVSEKCAARGDWTVRCLPLSCPVGVERAACKDQRCVVAAQ